MKSTGVLRRIDDLGRIVIPKEIRKHLRIRDGEYLEIYTEEETILLKKHSMINIVSEIAQLCIDSVDEINDVEIIISDRDKVIAASSGLKKKYIDKNITESVSSIILKREPFISKDDNYINIIHDGKEEGKFLMFPIIVTGDSIGIIIILTGDREVTEFDKKTAKFMAKMISNYLE